MNNYEIVLLLNPNSQNQIKIIIEKYTQIIEKDNGIITRIENWGKKNLAYTVKKNLQAIYLLLNITCKKSTLKILQYEIKHNETVIRNLITKTKNQINEPSCVINNKT